MYVTLMSWESLWQDKREKSDINYSSDLPSLFLLLEIQKQIQTTTQTDQ